MPIPRSEDAATATSAVDPRTIITPDSFSVASELIGLPLARPLRRAGAMILDLLPLALLINVSTWFFALVAAVVLWRASGRPADRATPRTRRKRRLPLRIAATALIFFVVLRVWNAIERRTSRTTTVPIGTGSEAATVDLSIRDVATLADLQGVLNASDPEAVRRHAERLAAWVESKSDSIEGQRAIARVVLSLVENEPVAAAAMREELGSLLDVGEVRVHDDSLIVAYARAVSAGDTIGQARLRSDAQSAIAGERILEMELEQDRLEKEKDRLERVLEERQSRGPLTSFFRGIAEDLGIGFGWAALYFTAFLALWNGQTPGKRLLGIQVIRLDGKPIGWWLAFERFGGYAASVSTGLLGFAQILWDRNRQGIHDKIVETVVIRVQKGKTYRP
jgi:hypothetical protein